MKRLFWMISSVVLSCFLTPVVAQTEQTTMHEMALLGNQGQTIGKVTLQQARGGILLTVKASNLPAGWHGMHFHSVGDCSDHASFHNAKGHVMTDGKPHGFLHPEGPHEGNLPNLIVSDDGHVEVELYSTLVSLHGQQGLSLLDEDGSALIIHANRDDHITQPIGGAGERIACAVIKGR